jgi:diacylglycerol kinase family enzyme
VIETLVIVNPISGAGRALNEFNEFKQNREKFFSFLKINSNEFSVVYTTADEEWKREASKYSNLKNIIVIGGDGTFHMVVKEFLLKGIEYRFLLIPGGRGNDFSKAIYSNVDLSKPFYEWIKENHSKLNLKEIDLGIVNEHLFINMASIGSG